MRETLPSGAWVDLIEVDALRASHTRQIEKHWHRQGALGDAATAAGQPAIDPETWANHASQLPATIVQIGVLGWELPYSPGAKLPRDNPPRPPSEAEPDGYDGWMEDISATDMRALRKALEPVRRVLLGIADERDEDGKEQPAPSPNDAILTEDGRVDPASPTPPASESKSSSREEVTSSHQPPTVSSVAGIGQPDTGGGSTGSA